MRSENSHPPILWQVTWPSQPLRCSQWDFGFAKTTDTKKTSLLAASWNLEPSSSRKKCPSGLCPVILTACLFSITLAVISDALPPLSSTWYPGSFWVCNSKIWVQWIYFLLKLASTGVCCLQLKTLTGIVMGKTHVVLRETIEIQEFKIQLNYLFYEKQSKEHSQIFKDLGKIPNT